MTTDVCNETDADKEVEVATTLSDGTCGKQTVVIPAKSKRQVTETLRVDNPRLWSPSSPNLYTATVSLSTGDSATETFGIRTIEYSADKGLLLNGNPCYSTEDASITTTAFSGPQPSTRRR